MNSPATRELVRVGKVRVVGALYDVGTGTINWLPASEVDQILANAEASSKEEKKSPLH